MLQSFLQKCILVFILEGIICIGEIYYLLLKLKTSFAFYTALL